MEGEFLGKARERGPVRVGEFVVESGVATEEAKDEDSQEGSPPCHISRSFVSAGSGDKGQAFAICEDDIPSTLDLVRPCSPDFQLGNWRVEERPGIYAASIM